MFSPTRPGAASGRYERPSGRKPYLRYQWPTSIQTFSELFAALTSKEEITGSYFPNYFLEQHGEWDPCDITDHAPGCFAENAPEGYARLIDTELDFEGEINDGREVRAPALTWWLEIGIGWTYDLENLLPLSFMLYLEDHLLISMGHQYTYENYYWVPTGRETLSFYEGVMPTSGKLIRMKHHDHMTLIEKTWIVAATKVDLQLLALPWNPTTGEPMRFKVTECVKTNAWLQDNSILPLMLIFGVEHLRGSNEPGKCPNTKLITTVELAEHGFSDLDEAETALRARIRALPDGESRLICELNRGLRDDVPGYPGFKFDR